MGKISTNNLLASQFYNNFKLAVFKNYEIKDPKHRKTMA